MITNVENLLVSVHQEKVHNSKQIQLLITKDVAKSVWILKRPGVEQFLKAISTLFDIVIYSHELSINIKRIIEIMQLSDVKINRIFGKEFLANEKYKIRSPTLL